MRGDLKAFDVKTGKLDWQTFTIPTPGEPGSETWPKDDSWKTGGGPTWLTGSYDADTDTLYWGVGNPGSWQSDQHPADNLWTDSMLALDPNIGKIKWGYQYMPNDGWDYDGMATPILVDTTIEGKPTKAAVVSNRNEFFTPSTAPTGISSTRSRSSRASTGRPDSIRRPASRQSTRR